jgi:hypothetical protein
MLNKLLYRISKTEISVDTKFNKEILSGRLLVRIINLANLRCPFEKILLKSLPLHRFQGRDWHGLHKDIRNALIKNATRDARFAKDEERQSKPK